MRDYQRKKGKYILPVAVYNIVIWQIRDYYRLKEEADAIICEGCGLNNDGMPHGSPSGDGVFNKVTRRMELTKLTDMIDDELKQIPKEYRLGVWQNIHYRTAFPTDAGRSTYAKWKSRFIYNLAKKQNLI